MAKVTYRKCIIQFYQFYSHSRYQLHFQKKKVKSHFVQPSGNGAQGLLICNIFFHQECHLGASVSQLSYILVCLNCTKFTKCRVAFFFLCILPILMLYMLHLPTKNDNKKKANNIIHFNSDNNYRNLKTNTGGHNSDF